MSAFVAATVYGSSLTTHSASAADADAFTAQNSQHRSRPQKQGNFSNKSAKKDSGPGKPNNDDSSGNDDSMPNYPNVESVQETQKRVDRMDEQLRRMAEVVDSDSDGESDEDQCLIEGKAGFRALPDSANFLYDLEQGKSLKKEAKLVWNNPKAKKEVLALLKRFGDPKTKLHEKPIKGLKNVTELKNSPDGVRIFIYRGKNKKPTVIGFCMRKNLNDAVENLKKNYK